AGETQRLFRSGGRISVDRWLKTIVLACGYCFTGGLGLLLAIPPGYATAVWPASGIALAGLLWWGPRVWPGIWVGSFLVNVWVAYATTNATPNFTSLTLAASIAIGSTLQAMLGALLVQRWVGAGRLFASAPAILSFTGIAALCCLLAPTWGVTSLTLTGVVRVDEFFESWRTWWLGDLIGVLVITPVLLTWRQVLQFDRRPWQLAEAIGSLILLAALTALAFVGPSPQGGGVYPLSFLPLPCLVWIACRYKPGGVALATCVFSAMAVIATCNGAGPFAGVAARESLLLLQGFTGLTTIMTLALAAAVNGQKQSETSLRKLSSELEQMALTDELTGLRNRRGFLLFAEQGWRMARRTHAKCLLVFFDLDGLKHVNDTQGHPAGDALIIDAAKVLTRVFRESDVIGRVGGDEFAVLSLLDKSDSAAAISKRLRKKIDDFNEQAGRSFHLSMSFGIEELSGAVDVSLEDLLSRADRAMYGQKRQNMRHRETRHAT
ncbi:MAG: MASE1 domain-containing protein, partial [Steroidobacteraceae bacterium]